MKKLKSLEEFAKDIDVGDLVKFKIGKIGVYGNEYDDLFYIGYYTGERLNSEQKEGSDFRFADLGPTVLNKEGLVCLSFRFDEPIIFRRNKKAEDSYTVTDYEILEKASKEKREFYLRNL